MIVEDKGVSQEFDRIKTVFSSHLSTSFLVLDSEEKNCRLRHGSPLLLFFNGWFFPVFYLSTDCIKLRVAFVSRKGTKQLRVIAVHYFDSSFSLTSGSSPLLSYSLSSLSRSPRLYFICVITPPNLSPLSHVFAIEFNIYPVFSLSWCLMDSF